MSAHTPGPWKASPEHVIAGPSGMRVARASNPDDARLIAAAPLLLTELEASVDLLSGLLDYFSDEAGHEFMVIKDTITRHRFAIAKARGEVK